MLEDFLSTIMDLHCTTCVTIRKHGARKLKEILKSVSDELMFSKLNWKHFVRLASRL